MLAWLISASLRHRLVVLLLWAGVAIAGLVAFRRLPIDAFPDTTPVQVQVNTVAPAHSPLEVERRATALVEAAIGGLPGLTEIRSLSRFGLSQVTVTFADGTDIWLARQVVGERLAGLDLGAGIEMPVMGPVATGLGEVFHYIVSSDEASLSEVRSVHDWLIRPQLRSVPGVAEVNAWGGDERQFQVVVDPVALQARGLQLRQLIEAIEANNRNVGGGTLDAAGESALVQGIGIVTRPSDLEEIVVLAEAGAPVYLRDVARVVDGRQIRRGAVTAGGKGEAVLGLGFMLMGENSHAVTSALSLRLTEVARSLPAGIRVEPVYERTALVDRVLHTVRTNLLEGAVLVVAVLFIFLGSLRAGLIVASAIPLSMLFAFDLMTRAGIAGSLMSLGAIDFGLVVDSSVILVENTMRRLAGERGRDRLDVIRDAALEVRRPTMFGELIILIVYVPILALEGIEGKLFRPMALTVIFALLGSMLLSLTLMPVLASFGLPRQVHERESWLVRGLKRLYAPVLDFALRQRALVLGAALLLVAGGALLAGRLGTEFVPRLAEGTIVVNTVRLAGVSVDESVRYGTQIERALLAAFPDEIDEIWTRTGTAEVATDPMGLEVSDVFITLEPVEGWRQARTQAELVAGMQSLLSTLPGMRAIFSQPIEMRVNEMVAGIRADVGVKIFGDDLDVLAAKASEVRSLLAGIPGATDLLVEQMTGQPLVRVEVDRQAIARHGIAADEVLALVELLGGVEVGELQEGERRFPIAVRLDDRYRLDADALRAVMVSAANGDRVPLGQLARVEVDEGVSTVNREWGKRRVVVQANVSGRDVGAFVADAQRALQRLELPAGTFIRFGGQFEHYQSARDRLLIVVPLALALILILLYFTYGRVLDALRVFTGVPFAAVGGILALHLRDIPFSISAGVGFVALSGVSVLGDMVLVSTIRQLLAEGLPLEEAVRTAGVRRLRPVLMTSLVAALGFLPMALNTGVGAEVQRPLATVVIGGLVSSTLLTLVVLPVLYAVFAKRGETRAAVVTPE
jgi:heavy metal efflux system protein